MRCLLFCDILMLFLLRVLSPYLLKHLLYVYFLYSYSFTLLD